MWCHTTICGAILLYVVPYCSTICGVILLHYMWCHTTSPYMVPYYSTVYYFTICDTILPHYMWPYCSTIYFSTICGEEKCANKTALFRVSGHITRGAFGIDHCKVLSFCFVYYSICIVTFDPFPRPPPDFIFLSDEMRHLRDKIYPWEQYFTAV